MNQNKRDTITSTNASRFQRDLQEQITMIELFQRLFTDLSGEPDDESLSWLAAALFSSNAARTLAKDCLAMIAAEHYDVADETFNLVIEQYQRFSGLMDNHKSKAPLVAATSAGDLQALEQQLSQITTELATWHSDQPAIKALMLALENAVTQAKESVLIGQGHPELMFTDSKIEAVTQSLIGQIRGGDASITEATAREMVDQVLGTTIEEKRIFLVNDSNTNGRVQSVNVQAGGALSAVGEVALAQSLARILRNLVQQSSVKVTAVSTETLDPVDLMLLEAEANMGKPIRVEQDGLLKK
ncbi:MAG: hypothetical protein C0508_23980 [Cyanobacteria bacterium PR.023]|jgi:hypothetical protein|nr:hypothetical protein [Cyanobacteria bacterium PR.023]MDQ5932855.1 hypothetical protein [Cyanobacteriota bacterium erpe_2018_sw_21hr_WHONDRS-SW48-000092_B_bin.40]